MKLGAMAAVVLSVFWLNNGIAQVSPSVKGVKPGVITAEPLNKAGTYLPPQIPSDSAEHFVFGQTPVAKQGYRRHR
jgi:hypothetical protein